MKAQNKYVIGIDYGTDSVRAIVVNAMNGEELATSVFYYPRWKKGLYCDPKISQYRQHPLDYIEGLETTIKECVSSVGKEVARNIVGISVDTTGSTPIAVDEKGAPLALKKGFEDNPNAMFILWKDHTSIAEADELNQHAKKFSTNYLKYVGGIYSSEWFWAKLLHVLRTDQEVRKNMISFVEHCDWIPFLLTGGDDIKKMKRGVCSAGHKSLWAEEFGGLPPQDFFTSWDPLLDGFNERLFKDTYTADKVVGNLSSEYAQKLGLSTSVVVGVGAFDCHFGAVGGQIEPNYMSKVIGTSTCDMMVVPIDQMKDKLIKGICGQVNGSIIPNMIGLEAGQSAFGDAFAWLKNTLMWSVYQSVGQSTLLDQGIKAKLLEEIDQKLLVELTQKASQIPLTVESEYALDWLNGRRTPDANQKLKGAFAGLSIGTDAPALYKALVESACFGAKAIIERFKQEGVQIDGIIALGGIAKKSPYIMQTLSDILNLPIKVHKSEQTCALGAAMFAATAAGIYSKVGEAMAAMGQGFEAHYTPNKSLTDTYQIRYKRYLNLGTFIESNLN
ncbi:MAG: ribulokinase [Bacteroidota bacterium]|nr:ribulokinase [Bacteroidota bacterium]